MQHESDRIQDAVDRASAALLLEQFRARREHLVARGPEPQMNDDDRAALVAAQLGALVDIGKRLAEALETAVDFLAVMAYPGQFPAGRLATPTAAGKTHTVAEFLHRYGVPSPPFTVADAARYGGEDGDYEDGAVTP